VYVGGFAPNGEYGARVLRLQPDGALDPSYGRDGIARIDLEAPRTSVAAVEDLQVLSDGRVVAGGNFSTDYWATTAFVARLLGAAGSSPGVIGLAQYRVVAPEQSGSATLKVQRSGGRSGPVAVTYSARAIDPPSATAGGDFTVVSGQLTWADGDDGEREIVVPLATDSTSEFPERFEVVLTAPEGGAGLGATGAEVEIADAGYPAGIFTLFPSNTSATEGETATFYVARDYYAQGAVSVTVRVRSAGTAEPGKDFVASPGATDWQDVVVSWSDGEYGSKPLNVQLVRDSRDETDESFTLELASPSGGAVLGEPRQASLWIVDANNSSSGGGGGGGGGGTWGGLGALLLGLAGLARRRWPRLR
jgi:MYXO-CTERM domain-containing protein